MEENKQTVEDVKVEETGNVETQTTEKNEAKAEQTFTQEQVNSMMKKEKQKIENKYKDIDLKKYNEWVESQKTAEEKQAEKEAEYQKVINENKALKNTNAVLEAGVNKKFIKFVSFEVSQMEGEFDENLAKFLNDNPEYLQGKELAEPRATGAPVKTIDSNNDDGVLSILKKKHPEMNF